jgi:hypothetical protein
MAVKFTCGLRPRSFFYKESGRYSCSYDKEFRKIWGILWMNVRQLAYQEVYILSLFTNMQCNSIGL